MVMTNDLHEYCDKIVDSLIHPYEKELANSCFTKEEQRTLLQMLIMYYAILWLGKAQERKET